MTTRNDITGDEIKTKDVSDKYRENFDRIFKKTEAMLNGLTEEQTDETMSVKGLKEKNNV